MKNASSQALQTKLAENSSVAPHVALFGAFRNGYPLAYATIITILIGAFIYLVCFKTMAMLIQMQRTQQGLSALQPAATSRPTTKFSILIAANGAFSLEDGTAITDLSKTLKQFIKDYLADEFEVTIQADEKANYDRVIDALNALAKAKIKAVTFETTGTPP